MLNLKANKNSNDLEEITKEVFGEQVSDISSLPKPPVSIFDFLKNSSKEDLNKKQTNQQLLKFS